MLLPERFGQITTFVFDVDGVLTDGTLLILENRRFIRRMHIKDGYALQLAIKRGYRILILSGAGSDAVVERLKALGITDIQMNVLDKKARMLEYARINKLSPAEILFMGDDMPDLEALKEAGLGCTPADAVNELKEKARYISPYPGGAGCVRDVIEKVLKERNHWLGETGIASQ